MMHSMDKYETRRLRLLKLVGDRFEGRIASLAKAIQKDSSYVHRILYEPGKPGRKRIADDMREHIEQTLGLGYGWLDGVESISGKIQTKTEISATLSGFRVEQGQPGHPGAFEIPYWDARGSCGGGALNQEQPPKGMLIKEQSWFDRFDCKPGDCVVVYADGDSMADYICDGDMVFFNKSKTTPKSGKVYLIQHPDGLRIKQLRREIDGTWVLESRNPDKRRYPDERIPPGQSDLLIIVGEQFYRQG